MQNSKITIVLKGKGLRLKVKRVLIKRYRIFDELLTKGQSSDLSEVALLCIRAGSIIISAAQLNGAAQISYIISVKCKCVNPSTAVISFCAEMERSSKRKRRRMRWREFMVVVMECSG